MQYEGDSAPPERKPIRKMTPPREELARGIAGSERTVAGYDREVVRSGEPGSQEEELPPAEYTRSMLAKFRQIEDTSAPVPSPARSAQVTSSARRSQTAVQQHHRQPVNRPSPDSGQYKLLTQIPSKRTLSLVHTVTAKTILGLKNVVTMMLTSQVTRCQVVTLSH